jgi:hypothetical protein
MLIVLRSVFSGLLGPRPVDAERAALRLEVEFELDKGDLTKDGLGLEGARSFDAGDAARVASVDEAVLVFLGLGSGGRDPVGGLVAGRDGCGSADIEAMIWIDGQGLDQ